MSSAIGVCAGRLGAATLTVLRFLLALTIAAAFLTIQNPTDAAAQCGNPPCPPSSETGNANLAASGAVFGATQQFLQRLVRNSGGQSAAGSDNAGANALAANRFWPLAYGLDAQAASQGKASNNPLAAYAAAPAQTSPRYRTWFEGYGARARTDGQGTYTGDTRKAFGGVAGIGATLAPGVNVGASVDQGHTKTDVTGGTQYGRLDMTQVGATASFDSGPWTLAAAGSYGFGRIHSARLETGGEASAFYDTHMWGALAELSYYWSSGHWRVVPKAGFDWAQGTTDSFVESGGTTPVMGSAQTSTRTRAYGAIEFGYTNKLNEMNYDISAYGKVIDIVSQDVPALLVTPLNGTPALVVPGVLDKSIEFATGTSLGLRLTSNIRVYVNYDGRFRSDFDSHAGTVGMEYRW
jgi:uncharacterized protein with beta-barrel porin domain